MPTSPSLLLRVFAGAIFLSAALLFAVQPMFTKMVLPRLGGTPSVWSVAMVFFQAVLLAGYAYAHALTKYFPGKRSITIHLVVMVVAVLFLPLSIASWWGRPPADATAALWLLGLFAVSIGVPFFALSANGPLLQAWFARTDHPSAANPYFLYAASNVGSFLALISYPFIVEPFTTLGLQRWAWAALFVALIALHRLVRRADAAHHAQQRSRRRRRARGRADLAAGRALDRARRGPLGAADLGDGAHLDRHRGRALHVGDPARALSRHLRDRVPDPARSCRTTGWSRSSRCSSSRWSA